MGDRRNIVDRDQLQDVHQQDPDKNRQCQRGNQRVLAVENIAHDALNEFEGYFDQVLQSARCAVGDPVGHKAEQAQEQDTHGDRPAEGIDVERHEAHVCGFLAGAREGPGGLLHDAAIRTLIASRKLAVGKVGKVVFYILYWGISCHTALVQSSLWSRSDEPAQCRTQHNHHSKSE